MGRLTACWKRRLVVPLGAVLLACALSGCMGWFIQLSSPDGSLAGVACPSATGCIAVGSGSGGALIEQTTNAGGSWTSDLSGVSGPSLRSVSCPDATTCLAVGDSGTILVSDDGGSSWTQTTVPDVLSPASLTSVSCPDGEHCWASVGVTAPNPPMPGSPFQTAGHIEATSDGGKTWSQQTWTIPTYDGTYIGQVSGADGISLSISCPSTTVCVGVGEVTYLINPPPEATVPNIDARVGVLVYTNDGGMDWSSVLVGLDGSAFTAESCPTVTTCVALGVDGMYDQAFSLSSSSGGSGWAVSSLPVDSLLPVLPDGAIDCLDPTHCLAVGTAYNSSYGSPILSTSDGGTTWHPQGTADPQATLEAVTCVTASSCWSVGSDSNGAVILHTVTGGAAWPSVTGVSPSQGPLAGGTTVTVSGVHFDLGVTSVSFGNASTTDFTLVSASELTVTAPAAPSGQPTSVDVQVHSPLGRSPLTPDDRFTYNSG